jgi:hypothetical protein
MLSSCTFTMMQCAQPQGNQSTAAGTTFAWMLGEKVGKNINDRDAVLISERSNRRPVTREPV